MGGPLKIDEAAGKWDPSDFWTEEEYLAELERQIAALPKPSGKKFDESQPRDDHGRWSETGGGGDSFSDITDLGGIDEIAEWGAENLKPDTPLTEEEIAAVSGYVGNGFETINAGLRGADLDQYGEQDVAQIDAAIEKSTLPALTLWRGTEADYSNLKPGDTLQDGAFLSTSLNRHTAEAFSTPEIGGTPGQIVKIEAPAGTHGLYITTEMAMSDGETEVLLPRDTVLTVVANTDRELVVRANA